MRRAPGAWPAALLALAACGAPRTFVSQPGPYDRVPAAWLEPLAEARLAFERGDAHAAYASVAELTLEAPQVLPVRVFLQELELELLTREGKLGGLAAQSADEARAVLARFYEQQADGGMRAEAHVLAARLAHPGETALSMLDEADTLDARCVWVHYARAWWHHELRDFKAAREAVRSALRLDGGHLPTLRLHATLLAGAGDYADAARVLEVWLERSAKSPLFSATERADGLLDLAALEVLLGNPRTALERLEEIDPRALRDPVRAEEVRAAACEARGDLTRALEAVARANAQRPDALLPLVQRAMLLRQAGDVAGERKTWLRLLELTEESEPGAEEDLASIDFEAALFRLQAHARLARLPLDP